MARKVGQIVRRADGAWLMRVYSGRAERDAKQTVADCGRDLHEPFPCVSEENRARRPPAPPHAEPNLPRVNVTQRPSARRIQYWLHATQELLVYGVIKSYIG